MMNLDTPQTEDWIKSLPQRYQNRRRAEVGVGRVKKHYGPGPHKSGSSQDAHGKKGPRGGGMASFGGPSRAELDADLDTKIDAIKRRWLAAEISVDDRDDQIDQAQRDWYRARVQPIIDRGTEVRKEIVEALEAAESAGPDTNTEAIRIQSFADAAGAMKAASMLKGTISEIAHYEASLYPGMDFDTVYAILNDRSKGRTIRKRLEAFRKIALAGPTVLTDVKGTSFQFDFLSDDATSGSELADAVISSGVTFTDNTWHLPNRDAALALRAWAENRRYLAWTPGETKSFKGLYEKLNAAVASIPEYKVKMRETSWFLGDLGIDASATSISELMSNAWMETAEWTDAKSTMEKFKSDKEMWSGWERSVFAGTSPTDEKIAEMADRGFELHKTTDIIDSLLTQADWVEKEFARWDEAQTKTLKALHTAQAGAVYAQADIVRGVLAKHREFGGDVVAVERRTATAKLVEEASRYYPSDWVEMSNDRGKIKVLTSSGRGDYTYNDRMRIRTWGQRQENAMHELGHRMEHVNDNLSEREREFYNARTLGTKRTLMQVEQPGRRYTSGEWTRKDEFSDPYMGRDYDHGGFELVSMGVPKLYGLGTTKPKATAQWKDTEQPFGMDPEMADFIIGVLLEA